MTRPIPRTSVLSSLLALAFALGGCAASVGTVGAQTPPADPPSTGTAARAATLADGAYTPEQAVAGAEVFSAVCLECHDTIEFKGSDFWFAWEGSNVGRLVRVLVETMPDDNPGALSMEQYLAVVAYILELNEFPVGANPLPDDGDYLAGLTLQRAGASPGTDPGASPGAGNPR